MKLSSFKIIRLNLTIAMTLVATFAASAPTSARLIMTDLGTLGGPLSVASTVNDRGLLHCSSENIKDGTRRTQLPAQPKKIQAEIGNLMPDVAKRVTLRVQPWSEQHPEAEHARQRSQKKLFFVSFFFLLFCFVLFLVRAKREQTDEQTNRQQQQQ